MKSLSLQAARNLLVAVLLLLAPIFSARAEDIYVAQTAQGADTGADAADAHSVAWFNTSSNWNSPTKVSGEIGPGDTVHLCGTITSPLTIQASGTAGNVITIFFQSGAKMTAPYWTDSAILSVAKDYITIDGGTNGIIECTANGSTLANHQQTAGIHLEGGNHVTVQNLLIENMYDHTDYNDEILTSPAGAKGIWCDTYNGNHNFTYLTIQNCIIHDASAGISIGYHDAGTDFVYISGCDIYNCNFDIQGGENDNNAHGDHWFIHDNHLHDWANWDSVTNQYHHNGIYIWSVTPGAYLSDIHIYNNTFGPGFTVHNSCGMFAGANYKSLYFYNNLLVLGANDSGPMDGMIGSGPYSGCTLLCQYHIWNNTFVGNADNATAILCSGGGSCAVGSLYDIQNNLIYNLKYGIGCSYMSANMPIDSDHNLYYRNLLGGAQYAVQFSYSTNGTGHFYTWTAWQGLGYDAHSVYGLDPLLDSTYRPTTGSPAVGAGANLYGIITVDKAGNARAASGPWVIGAYIGSAGLSVIPPSNPQTSISVQ